MAKFNYRMQNILEIKFKMEAQAKTQYTNMLNRYNDEKDRLEKLFMKKRQLEDDYRRMSEGTLNVRNLMDGKNAIEFATREIKDQLVEVKVAEKNFNIARMRLNEVMKDRKTHEKLREKAFEDFLVELGAQENKEIDELVSYRYNSRPE